VKLLMFDFLCDNGHSFEELVQPDIHEIDCPHCELKAQRQISAVRLDWRKMGVDSDFSTCSDKWAKMQRQKAQKEDSVNLVHY
jgi:hypothetical protein